MHNSIVKQVAHCGQNVSSQKSGMVAHWGIDYSTAKNSLVRAADIVANHIFHLANENNGLINSENELHIFYYPRVSKNSII